MSFVDYKEAPLKRTCFKMYLKNKMIMRGKNYTSKKTDAFKTTLDMSRVVSETQAMQF